MSQYYYLAASLPMLQPEGEPPMGTDEFLERCERLLSARDYEEVRRAKLNAPAATPSHIGLFSAFQDAEFGVRNELVKLRARKLEVEVDRYLREEKLNPLWAAAAREVMEQENPLRREIELSRVLWRVLDHLSVGHYFDIDFLAAYHLKLQILERIARFEEEAGLEKLESILTGDKKDG